jgi:hypothetical protein
MAWLLPQPRSAYREPCSKAPRALALSPRAKTRPSSTIPKSIVTSMRVTCRAGHRAMRKKASPSANACPLRPGTAATASMACPARLRATRWPRLPCHATQGAASAVLSAVRTAHGAAGVVPAPRVVRAWAGAPRIPRLRPLRHPTRLPAAAITESALLTRPGLHSRSGVSNWVVLSPEY